MVVLDISWMDGAACTSRPDLPWTTDTAKLTAKLPGVLADDLVADMVEVCEACPVLASCAGMAVGMDGGFWAGRDRAIKPKPKRRSGSRERERSWVQPSLGLEDLDGDVLVGVA